MRNTSTNSRFYESCIEVLQANAPLLSSKYILRKKASFAALKNSLYLLVAIVCFAGCQSVRHPSTPQNLVLAQDKISCYAIILPENPDEVLQTAAKELSDHLHQITEGTFQIYTEDNRPAGVHALIIGSAKAAESIFEDPNFRNAKPDAIAIRFKDGDIYLNGQMPRGPLYAVYTFLEDYAGVRWWTSTESFIPEKHTLTVEAKDLDYAPPLVFRESSYRDINLNGAFAARLKGNGHYHSITPAFGGHRSIIGFCHTFYQFLPPEKYFAEHPDWYSMDANGKRNGPRQQLCLTNEEMRKEFVKVCLAKIKENPQAGMISVSQNDWQNYCQCPNCKSIEEEEGSPSGPLLRFVNAIAADIEKEYPDFYVETLAYQYTRKAPKITKPAHNVVIRLCSIECNYAQSIEDGASNASFRNDLEKWSSISQNLFIWNYIANFRNLAILHPNYRNIAKDLRYFVKNHAMGIFEHGDGFCEIGDFIRPRNWIVAHLCWNPDLDEKELAKEFFQGYYGNAGPYLLKYLDFLCDTIENSGASLPCYATNCNTWMDGNNLSRAWQLFAEAENAVKDNPILTARVRRERFSLDLTTILCQKNIKKTMRYQGNKSMISFPVSTKTLLDEMKQYVAAHKVFSIREGRTNFTEYWKGIENELSSLEQEKIVPAFCKDLPESDWDYFAPSDFHRYEDKIKTEIVDDANASSGKAVYMATDHNGWFIQKQLENCYGAENKWKFRIDIRCDANSNDGIAVEFGLYSPSLGKTYYKRVIMIDECKGMNYSSIITEPVTLTPDTYFWFAPVSRPLTEIKAIYLDSVTMLRE